MLMLLVTACGYHNKITLTRAEINCNAETLHYKIRDTFAGVTFVLIHLSRSHFSVDVVVIMHGAT